MNEEEIKQLREEAMNSFLETLQDGGVITESFTRKMLAKIDIEDGVLLENRYGVDPFGGDNQRFRFEGSEVNITIDHFYSIYDDFRFKTANDVMGQISAGGANNRTSSGKVLSALFEWYRNRRKSSNPRQLPPLPRAIGERKEIIQAAKELGMRSFTEMWNAGVVVEDAHGYAVLASDIGRRFSQDSSYDGGIEDYNQQVFGDDFSQPVKSEKPIHMGQQGRDTSRTGRAADKINELELMAGELYTNITRIPRPAVFKWLNLFKKDVQKAGLAPEKNRSGVWKKVFLIGYQIEARVVLEIWFNTLDSTFTVHDFFGNTIGRRYPSMNEAVRRLILAAAKFSPDDKDIFQNPANRSLATSFFRPLISSADEYAQEIHRKEHDLYRKEREKEEEKRNKQRADEMDRQSGNDKASKESKKRQSTFSFATNRRIVKAKNAIKGGVSSAVDQVGEKIRKEREDIEDLVRDRTKQKEESVGTEHIVMRTPTPESIEDHMDGNSMFAELVGRMSMNLYRNEGAFLSKMNKAYRDGEIGNEEVALLKGIWNTFREVKMIEKKNGKSQAAVFLNSRSVRDRIGDVAQTILRTHYSKPKKEEVGVSSKPYVVNENFDALMSQAERAEELAMNFDEETNNPQFQNRMNNVREQARKESATFRAIQKAFNNTIVMYDDTKLSPNAIKNMISKHIGKHNLTRTLYNKVLKFFRGTKERADFHVGYSVQGRLSYEIWQITQANPDYDENGSGEQLKRTLTAFFLFDVTSGTPKLIRGSLPYLRNAQQALIQVVGIVGRSD